MTCQAGAMSRPARPSSVVCFFPIRDATIKRGLSSSALRESALERQRLYSGDPICADHDPATAAEDQALHGAAFWLIRSDRRVLGSSDPIVGLASTAPRSTEQSCGKPLILLVGVAGFEPATP